MYWAVIIAGGSGERFWPKSRQNTPKQLLPITAKETMIELTVKRLEGLIPPKNILVITNTAQKEEMIRQLHFLPVENIISEPMGRDTAAAIGLGAVLIKEKDNAGTMIVLPADQVIHDSEAFKKTVESALDSASKNDILITFGISPSYPATGYGYIKTLEALPKTDIQLLKVDRFVEKPDEATARKYVESGSFLWNSGMFVWQADIILNEIKKNMPDLFNGLNKISSKIQQSPAQFENILKEVYPTLEKKSVDYGIMEKASNVFCCKAKFDWDDVGSWESIGKHFASDESGNISIGQVRLINCRDMLVYNVSKNDSLIATAIDMQNAIIVQTDDAVLVCPKDSSQKVKTIVEILKKEKLSRYL